MRKGVFLFSILFFIGFGVPSYAAGRSLTVAAASDLSFAMREIGEEFEKVTGIRVVFSFGSSGKLAQQIEYGAPFNLFFSANRGYVERLERKGFVRAKGLYAKGRIVLAVNRESEVHVKGLQDLLRPEIKRIAIANPAHAPYGVAAKEALKSSGLWEKVRGKLVYGENIRQALQFVQTGDAQAGIVALSIADVPEVTYTMIDPSLYNPIDQVVAVIKGTEMVGEAEEFVRFVMGPKGRAVMERYGFIIPLKVHSERITE